MFDNLANAPPLLQIFWYIAIPTTVFFLIQSILTFIGADAESGIGADFDGGLDDAAAPFQLFSLRNLINFLLGFSWGGIAFYNVISNKTILVILAFIIGILFVALFLLIIKQMLKLTENNSFTHAKTIGLHADVHLTIPANKTGKGKILISVNGSVHELAAITEGECLPHGSIVKVVKVDKDLLIVERI